MVTSPIELRRSQSIYILDSLFLYWSTNPIWRSGRIITPSRLGGVGWIVNHRFEPDSGRATRWWACALCSAGQKSPYYFALRSGAHDRSGHGLVWMVAMGIPDFRVWASIRRTSRPDHYPRYKKKGPCHSRVDDFRAGLHSNSS